MQISRLKAEHIPRICAHQKILSRGESKTALDNFYSLNAKNSESHYDFCVRHGWKDYVDTMITVDYIILNRDRHGANIEVLRNSRTHTLRPAPLFDHGLTLLYSCLSETEVEAFDVLEDKRCQNFIGSFSSLENLELIHRRGDLFRGKLTESDRSVLFEDLYGILPDIYYNKIWDMIWRRYNNYLTILNE